MKPTGVVKSRSPTTSCTRLPHAVLKKGVTDVLDVGYAKGSNNRVRRIDRVAEEMRQYDQLSIKQLNSRLQKMENAMYEHARNLEFEDAAKLRDQITEFKNHFFINPMPSMKGTA